MAKKKRMIAKIGTHSSTEIVLWNDKPIIVGTFITAMEADIYDSLHSKWRDLKYNRMWKEYYVTKIGLVLFLSN